MRSLTLRDLEDLGPRRFEELVAAVVLAGHPGAEQLGGKDGGADVLLERRGATDPKVWQVKHYPRDIHWAHCEESLDSAVAKHGAGEIVFVFPRDMSYTVKKTFKRRLVSRHPGVEVSYMAGSQIIHELRQRDDDLVEEFFGLDPRDQARVLAEHLGSRGLQISKRPDADEISQRLELADLAGRRDRYFRTEVAVTTGDIPPPAWAEAPSLLLTSGDGDRALRIAAWPEKDGGIRIDDFCFPEGEEGRRIRWEVGNVLASQGAVQLPLGVSLRPPRIPEAVRAISDAHEFAGLTVTPSRSHPVELAGELDGKHVERRMELVAVPPLDPPPDGMDAFSFGGIDDELSFFITFHASEEMVTIRIEPSLHLTGAWSPRGALEAARLLLAWDLGTGILHAPSLDPSGSLALGCAKSQASIELHRHAVQLFENLVTIQGALQVDRFDAGEEIGGEALEVAATAVHILENQSGYVELARFQGEMTGDELDRLKRHKRGPFVVRFPLSLELLGNELGLGIAEAEVPQPDSLHMLEESGASGKQFEFRWRGEPNIPFKVISPPGLPSPETGIWAPGEAP